MPQLLDLILSKNKSANEVLLDFTESQKLRWPLAKTNFDGLKKVEERSFDFDNFQYKIQFNPERMRSSVANVDKASIEARKCFLCKENRPKEQESIKFGKNLSILVNPFPIFNNHFTISSTTHVDQRFRANIRSMLELSHAMVGFTVFYNGPECGASAPDHFHFQAGESEFLPISTEFDILKLNSESNIYTSGKTSVWAFNNYLRKMISIESNSINEVVRLIEIFYDSFAKMQSHKQEPMLNALATYNNCSWVIHLFPRKAHRPSQFFEEGEKQILLSPGSVDFGGVFITPRREDFDKISMADISDILNQVCIDTDDFYYLTDKIKSNLY